MLQGYLLNQPPAVDALSERRLIEEQIKVREELINRQCTSSFYDFFRIAWDIIWPETRFKDNWHYKVLCDELQKQVERIGRGEPKEYDLLINVPPRTGKSTLHIALTAWAWIPYPHQKFLFASYDDALSVDHSTRARDLIQSRWYRNLIRAEDPDDGKMKLPWKIRIDKEAKHNFENSKGGYRIATSVGGRGIGFGANWLVPDDPQSQKQSHSEAFRKSVIDWWDGTMFSRLNDPEVDIRMVIQQRLHEQDLTGHILSKNGMKFKLYCIPAEKSDHVRPKELKKFYINGLMFPSRLTKSYLADAKVEVGSYNFAGQYDQRPAPEEGGIFKRIYWNFWRPIGSNLPAVETRLPDGTIHTHQIMDLPEKLDYRIGSGDLAFKGKAGSDRVAIGDWGRWRIEKFLLDEICGQMDYVKTRGTLKQFYLDRIDFLNKLIIEDKANGPAVMSDLQNTIPILVAVTPLGSKVARALEGDASKGLSMVAQCEAGHIWLPHPSIAGWVWDFIEEFAVFPNGKYDDRVDQSTQAIQDMSVGEDFEIYTSSMHRKKKAIERKEKMESKEGDVVEDGHGNVIRTRYTS